MTRFNLLPNGSHVVRAYDEPNPSYVFWVNSTLRITIKPLPSYLSPLRHYVGLDRHRKVSGWHYSI